MGDGTDRVEHLVAGAETETVTESLLVGGDEYAGEFFLYGDAPIERLGDGEQPHATLFNDMKGVGIGSKRDTVTPDGGARSVFVVTDERVLVLVGKQDGDWERSVPLADVTGAGYHTGFMKHRVVVDTVDSRYHLWVDASYDERELRETVELLEAAGDRAGSAATDAGSPGSRSTDAGGAAGGGVGDGGVQHPQEGVGAGRADAADAPAAESSTASEDGTGPGDDGGDADALDKLERLKALHDQGVLTDEEFERKKADLLDQI